MFGDRVILYIHGVVLLACLNLAAASLLSIDSITEIIMGITSCIHILSVGRHDTLKAAGFDLSGQQSCHVRALMLLGPSWEYLKICNMIWRPSRHHVINVPVRMRQAAAAGICPQQHTLLAAGPRQCPTPAIACRPTSRYLMTHEVVQQSLNLNPSGISVQA